MSFARRFLNLPRKDKALAIAALWALVVCRVGLALFNAERLRLWSARRAAGTNEIAPLVRAVRRAAIVVPGSTCLMQALALQRLLSQNGHPSDLRIGVRKSQSDFAAHAWLVSDGAILIGDGEEARTFVVLTSWASPAPEAVAQDRGVAR